MRKKERKKILFDIARQKIEDKKEVRKKKILSLTFFYRVLKTIKMSCLNELSFYCVKRKYHKRKEKGEGETFKIKGR